MFPPHAVLFGIMLLLGGVAGFAMHRGDYCIAGMFRDYFLFRQTHLLRSLLLLVACSALLFEGARLAGLLPAYPFFLAAPPLLAGWLGGALFGIGMVLAGGCVVGTLYKLGAGSTLSAVALFGMVAGSGVYAELHPWWQELAAGTRFAGTAVTLPQHLQTPPTWLLVPLLGLAGVFVWRWQRRGLWVRRTAVAGYWQPWQSALVLAGIGLLSYLTVGMPLGITTFYAKLAAWGESLVAPQHVAQVGFFQETPLDAALPWLGTRLVGGPGTRWDAIAVIQGATVLGIVLGSAVSAVALGEFRLRTQANLRQYGSVLVGGALLGIGSRTACGCNIWFLFGGVPILSLQSLVFVAGLVPGAWLGSRLLVTLVLPAPKVGTQDPTAAAVG